MPILTHILAAALTLAVVLIHLVWRWWHQAPPRCEGCGRYNCRGGTECVGRKPTEPPVEAEPMQDNDYFECPHCGAHFSEAWISSEAGPAGRDGVDCPRCGAFIADEELMDDMRVWREVCEGIDKRRK